MTTADVRVGISGWRYPPWRGEFYPPGLPQREELPYAASRLRTIEINGSFYSLQAPAYWRQWRDAVPRDFEFAVKGGRFVTHMKRLRDAEAALATFFASSPLLLDDRLGPILWQLPPNFQYDRSVLAEFFAELPWTEGEAAALARKNERTMPRAGDEPLWQRARRGRGGRRLRHALEVRHLSFRNDDFCRLCKEYGVAIVVSDGGTAWPQFDEITADHMYVRLHGADQLYVSGYPEADLDRWADRVRGWAEHPDIEAVRVYFDNDVKVRAPYDAMSLARRLGVGLD
ncbi:MAG: DUF72 domain-containing protein [Actinomycetales bacterium]